MATNREKYIDNASNEELAKTLATGFYQIRTIINISEGYLDVEKKILNWLSQKVKEDEDKEWVSCNVCTYAISNGYSSSFMHHHICMNPKSVRYNKGVDVVNDGCNKGETKEVEEDIVNIPQIGKMPKTDKTKSSFNVKNIDLEKEIINLKIRVQELEEFTKIQMDDFWKDHYKATHNIQLSGYSYGSIEKEKTADQMFEELGYEKDTFDEFGANEIVYINNNKDHIIVRKNGHYIKYNYYDFHPDFDYNDIKFITEAEDKAIHKKISELKEEWKNGK